MPARLSDVATKFELQQQSWGFSCSRRHKEQRTLNSYFYTMHYDFGFTNFSMAPVIVYPNCHDNKNL